MVAMPFDPGAQTRKSEGQERTFTCEIINRATAHNKETSMPALNQPGTEPPAESRTLVIPPVNNDAAVAAARAAAQSEERTRIQGIFSAVRAAKLDNAFAETLITEGVSVDVARARIIDKWSEGQANRDDAPEVRGQTRVVADECERWAQGAQAGLLQRAGLKGGEANEFTGLSLSELARSALSMRGISNGKMNRMAMVGAAFTTRAAGPGFHSTSDFGTVLANVAHRAMMTGFEEIPETFDLWTGVGTASDFRPIGRADLGLFPALDKIEEGAEYKYATIGDSGVTVQLATYGKLFAITRQAIINDDLGFFDRIPRKMGRAAKRTIGNLVYAIVNTNPTMQDGVALFHATHGNLGAGAVPSVTTIGAGRAVMARQKDDAGVASSVGVVPAFMLVPPELRDTAAMILSSDRLPGDAGQIRNPVQGAATLVSDPRLTGTAWYLAADPRQTDTIEVTYLDGEKEPFMDQKEGWNVDGSEFKVRLDAGVKALHWRGLYKNSGQ